MRSKPIRILSVMTVDIKKDNKLIYSMGRSKYIPWRRWVIEIFKVIFCFAYNLLKNGRKKYNINIKIDNAK